MRRLLLTFFWLAVSCAGENGTTDRLSSDLSADATVHDMAAAPDEVADTTQTHDLGLIDTDVQLTDFVPADTSPDGGPQTSDVASEVSQRVFVVYVYAIGDGKSALPGAQVEVLDNTTAKPLELSGTSNEEGKVEFYLPAGLVFALKVTKGEYVDRYYFDVKEEQGQIEVEMLPSAMIEMVGQQIGLQWDKSKGIVAGEVAFVSGGKHEFVGCATVESDKGGQAFYWDPETDMPVPTSEMPMTSKSKANYLIANVPAGPVTLTAKVSGVKVAERKVWSFAHALIAADLLVVGESNPTPPNCPY